MLKRAVGGGETKTTKEKRINTNISIKYGRLDAREKKINVQLLLFLSILFCLNVRYHFCVFINIV